MRTPKAVARLDGEVERALRGCGLAGGKLLVTAVSGGPDSLAMLFSLVHLREGLGLELHGAHLDHGLRGDASEADARFVTETFRRLGIAYTSERADVPSYRTERRMSVEEAAREVRYAFLSRVARERRADAVALGHTSDDQAESVLMHIMRGSGLTGLRGMQTSTRASFAGTEVLLARPLLGSSRKDTLAYCRALDLEPRLDETNISTEPRRNRVRAELLPLMEEFNPAVREALVRLSRSAAQQVEYLDREVDSVWREASDNDRDVLSVRRDVFQRLPAALKAHLLRRAVSEVKGDLREVRQDHVDDMERLMSGPAGRTLDLPGRIRFSVGDAKATITSSESDPCPLPPLEGEDAVNIPGETRAGGWRVLANVSEGTRSSTAGIPLARARSDAGEAARIDPLSEHAPDGFRAELSYEAVAGGLSLRARSPGDRFQPLGMSGHKKLQDFMVDAKIPRECRDRVPLVVSARGIAWVAGWRIADWARVGRGQQRVLELRLLPESADES